MATYYSKINDHFSHGIDWSIWDAPYSPQASQRDGSAILTTNGSIGDYGLLNARRIASDGTPLSPQRSNTSLVFETTISPKGRRVQGGVAYAATAYVYRVDASGNYFETSFQLWTRVGEGTGTTYSLATATNKPGTGYVGSTNVLANITVGQRIWLRISVERPSGDALWEYSTNGTTWTTARREPAFYSTSIGLNVAVVYESYNAAGPSAEAHFDYITVKNTEPPEINFTSDVQVGYAPLTVNFNDLSPGTFTAWNWDFGDGGTSTAKHPTHTYTEPGWYDVSLTATNRIGTNTLTKSSLIGVVHHAEQTATIASSASVGVPTAVFRDPPPPPPTDWEAVGKEDEKVYIYKVYDSDGTFLGVWTDVKDDPQFTQHINTPGTTMTALLARSPNTTKEVRAPLITEAGDPITTEDGHRLAATYETNNSVGEGTDVDLNYNVDVYVHYGEYGRMLTQDSEPITTEDGEYLVVALGAPMGVRVFSGFILDYESVYGEDSGVTVTLASHGYELSNELIRSGETTNVTYSTTEIATIVKSVLDTNPGRISYDDVSIQTTGQNITAKFQLNTKLEGIKSVFDQTPDGWYWFGNPADNLIYLRQRSATPTHTFVMGKHIKSMRLKRSMEGLTNRVYFVGGETVEGNPSTTLFKKYEDTTSQAQWRVGLERITDRRYTLATSAQNRAMKQINRFAQPVFTTPLTISSARYDLESIKLGDTVGFANAGNFIDSVVLQIVALTYTPTAATMELGELLDRQVDTIAEVDNSLQNEQYRRLPNAPS